LSQEDVQTIQAVASVVLTALTAASLVALVIYVIKTAQIAGATATSSKAMKDVQPYANQKWNFGTGIGGTRFNNGTTASDAQGKFHSPEQIPLWTAVLDHLGKEGWAIVSTVVVSNDGKGATETLWTFSREMPPRLQVQVATDARDVLADAARVIVFDDGKDPSVAKFIESARQAGRQFQIFTPRSHEGRSARREQFSITNVNEATPSPHNDLARPWEQDEIGTDPDEPGFPELYRPVLDFTDMDMWDTESDQVIKLALKDINR
jgi:hypothetical protein